MTDEDELHHHGVKGMRWGVRKEDDTGGRRSAAKDPIHSAEMQKYIADLGLDSNTMRMKYGKGSNSKTVDKSDESSGTGLNKNQKIAIGVGGAAAAFGAYAYLKANPGAAEQLKGFFSLPENVIQSAYKNSQDGFDLHWEKGLDLPAGTLFHRVSTAAETEIRQGGFFAAFDQADVDRYKGVLPEFWKQWGYGETEGFINTYKAGSAIKAPSGKETMSLIKEFYSTKPGNPFLDLDYSPMVQKSNRDYAFMEALSWAGEKGHPEFFDFVKSKGYNALIDFNDAGKLAKTPVRLIDGSIFEIQGHEKLSFDAISAAQKRLLAMAHSNISLVTSDGRKMSTLDELRHHGVKGMKWGVRKAERDSPDVTLRAKPGGKIKTAGGAGLKAHEDAKSAAASRQVARRSSTNALSNQELQKLVARMNLEQQYARLEHNDPTLNRGSKFVRRLLGDDLKLSQVQSASDQALAASLGAAIKQKVGAK